MVKCNRCQQDYSSDDIYMTIAINQKSGELHHIDDACSSCLNLPRPPK